MCRLELVILNKKRCTANLLHLFRNTILFCVNLFYKTCFEFKNYYNVNTIRNSVVVTCLSN